MKYLIWDFDGTLAYRRGRMWSVALFEILQRELPELPVTVEHIRPFLRGGFPWHTPSQPHTAITTPDQWWDALDGLFERAFLGVGVDAGRTASLAKQVRQVYPDPGAWRLFDDVLPALAQLSSAGWTHLVLSNHAPELRHIMHSLQLDPHILRVFNSAETGYEKPHPQAFRAVLAACEPAETIWMIGDNMEADILGAEALGLPAILVRKFHERARHFCETPAQVAALVS